MNYQLIVSIIKLMENSLYRFRQINQNSISSLMNDELFASTPDQFNDPYDALFNYDLEALYKLVKGDNTCFDLLAKDILHNYEKENNDMTLKDVKIKYLKSKKQRYSFLNKLVIATLKNLRRQMLITCFCGSYTKEIMWSHYANYGRGFALEYSKKDIKSMIKDYISNYTSKYTNDFANTNSTEIYELKRVNYNSNRLDGTSIAFEKIKQHLEQNEMLRNGRILPTKYDCKKQDFASFVLYKSKSWEYEDEWRIVLPNHNINEPFARIGTIKPKAIYLGEFISFADKYTICCIARSKGIPIYQMSSSLGKKRFGLSKHNLTKTEIESIIKNFHDHLSSYN